MRTARLALAILTILGIFGLGNAADISDEEYADSYRAHLVVHKAVVDTSSDKLAYPLIVQGRNATIVISLHNAGTGPATDVKVKDVLPSNAQLLEGSLSVTYPKIASGSSTKHSYVIVFTSGGSMDVTFLPTATVTYQAEEDTEQIGLSTKAGVFVLTPVQQITRYALIAGTYASLGICRTPAEWRNMGIVLGLLGSLLGANFVMKSFTSRSTTTKRKKALQELEKDD